jgi:hypothetical protein
MEIINIVLDCKTEDGRHPFIWRRIQKKSSVLKAKLERLRRRKGKEEVVSFLALSGAERNELVPGYL